MMIDFTFGTPTAHSYLEIARKLLDSAIMRGKLLNTRSLTYEKIALSYSESVSTFKKDSNAPRFFMISSVLDEITGAHNFS